MGLSVGKREKRERERYLLFFFRPCRSLFPLAYAIGVQPCKQDIAYEPVRNRENSDK